MQKARKILALATGVAAVGCEGPAHPLGTGFDAVTTRANVVVSALAVGRPLTAPDGRPACGNVVSKGPRPPGCA